MSFFCVQNQPPETDGNGKTTCVKGGRNPPDVTLRDIFKDLLSFFNRFECLNDAKKEIQEKYDIKNDHGHYCWPEDDIKRAWGKTQRMVIKSSRRKNWAHVIMLQMVKRLVYDECQQNAVQQDHKDTTDDINQACETTPRIKEYSDVAPSSTEVNSNSSETKNGALVNENEDTLDNSCELRKSMDNHEELCLTDMPDQMKAERENGRWEDSRWSADDINQACGKAESIKGNPEDRSFQSNDELKSVGAAGGDKRSSGANRTTSKSGLNQTDSVSQGQTGTPFQATGNHPGAPDYQSGTDDNTASESKEAVKKRTEDETIYIRIPLSVMFDNEPTLTEEVVENVPSDYKLTDGYPSDTFGRIKHFYTMSFNNETNNAEWVYEILNKETLVTNVADQSFGDVYHKGHLAAAANHKWCWEAYNKTYLFSNIIPQHKNLNNSIWKKLENRCRDIHKNKNNVRNVHVYTGPLYIRDDHLRHKMKGKAVPTHLFKVIIVENVNGTVREPECYQMANEKPQSQDLNDYRVSIEHIQEVSGLTFIQLHHRNNVRELIRSVTWQGELDEIQHNANISVRIST